MIFDIFASRYGYTPEKFMDLTMRQVFKLLKVIGRARAIETYELVLSYRLALHAEKIPSLEEYLVLTLGEGSEVVQVFDEKTDKFLEDQALKRLAERQRGNAK